MAPLISVVVPCLNERATIGLLLEAVRGQTLPPGGIEVVIADGMSTDGTRQVIADYTRAHPELRVHVLDNPDRSIPAALNRAIAASSAGVVARLDAHSVPAPDYLARCLDLLAHTGAANVGGAWDIRPSASTWVARSVAAAAAHPLGAGDARYRTGGPSGPVDTVPFGAFPRAWLARVGGYDETLLVNEDYELNHRLRQAGGVIWFDPSVRSAYFSRPDLASLARQYERYGFWKARMLRRYPRSLRWRQAIPPVFVLVSVALAVIGLFVPLAAQALAVQWILYGLLLGAVGLERAAARRYLPLLVGLPLALAVIHLSWGVGFWRRLLTSGSRPNHGPA